MYKDLNFIKENIIEILIKEESKQNVAKINTGFEDNLRFFLERLSSPKKHEVIDLSEEKVKAAQQLLCCIGIDIKSEAVPAQHYYKILNGIDARNLSKEARHIFHEFIKQNKLAYHNFVAGEEEGYSTIVMPLFDWHYYIDKRLIGISKTMDVTEGLINRIKYLSRNGSNISLFTNIFDKKSYLKYFWIANYNEIDHVLKESKDSTTKLVDRLGLSHFDYTNNNFKYFFYLHLDGVKINTIKPNATMIDWVNPNVGFLSYQLISEGRTFSITGYQNYEGGLLERSFIRLELTEEQKRNCNVYFLSNAVTEGSLLANYNEVILEGISRFKKI